MHGDRTVVPDKLDSASIDIIYTPLIMGTYGQTSHYRFNELTETIHGTLSAALASRHSNSNSVVDLVVWRTALGDRTSCLTATLFLQACAPGRVFRRSTPDRIRSKSLGW
jgi:hypothetical protein